MEDVIELDFNKDKSDLKPEEGTHHTHAKGRAVVVSGKCSLLC